MNGEGQGRAAWYRLDVEEAAQRLDVDPKLGLDAEAVVARRLTHGENLIEEGVQRTLAQMLLGQFADFMILVLIGAAVVSGVIGEPQDTVAILVIVVLNAVIGVVQEYRAARAVAALREMAAPEARVVRDGVPLIVPARDLVPGDLVILEAGNLVPADLRLVDAQGLRSDESALTGESLPVGKSVAALDGQELALGDRANLAFKGSLVSQGRGRGLVVATGMSTELGRIAALLEGEGAGKTPLQRRLAQFGRRLALAIIAICALIFAAGLLQGKPLVLMFLTAISLAVAAIPEALPAVITVSLALGARKMSRHHALVRRLPAVETLGSVTYICADKTGTLTQNRMRAEFVLVGEERHGELTEQLNAEWPWLGRALALSNDVQWDQEGRPLGDPTELALEEVARQGGLDKGTLEARFPRVREDPFDSVTKRMTTVHAVSERFLALVKGAPEAVIPACTDGVGQTQKWTKERALQQAEGLALEGYRVLALASRSLDNPHGPVDQDLELLGLVALIDPPREEAPVAVKDCLSAGISPVMITGDHPGTALAIARRVGIGDRSDNLVTGPDLTAMSDEELAQGVERFRVYARVNPEQKIRIVRALQARNQFVAMTGDGVNDAPALQRADIGVAMGQQGTDVAREAADMVLLDDNFATIVAAVREGRRIFDNIRKFIKYTMTSNAGEIWTLFLAPFLGLPIPLLPIHILWINLVTDGLPGLALAGEPAERGVMRRPPRPPNESIFAHGMWQHMLWVGLLIGGLSILGQAWAYRTGSDNWQTVVFTVLTLCQLVHVLVIRTETESLFTIGLLSNRHLLGAVLLTLILQLMVIYVPFLNGIFKTKPLGLEELVVCMVLPLVVLVAVEGEKALMRRGLVYQNAG